MKVINITSEFVEVLWIDDNEIEFIPIEEFKTKYPINFLFFTYKD
jgi:hypothetical protein